MLDENLYNTFQKHFEGTVYSLIKSTTMCKFQEEGAPSFFFSLDQFDFNRAYLLECLNHSRTRFFRDKELNIIMKAVLCRKQRIKRLLEEI